VRALTLAHNGAADETHPLDHEYARTPHEQRDFKFGRIVNVILFHFGSIRSSEKKAVPVIIQKPGVSQSVLFLLRFGRAYTAV